MVKRLNWDAETKKQKANRRGAGYAYDELPQTGSWADRIRYEKEYEEPTTNSERKFHNTETNSIVPNSREIPASKCLDSSGVCCFCKIQTLDLYQHILENHSAEDLVRWILSK